STSPDQHGIEYVGASAVFRRRLAITAVLAVAALVAVSAGLALRQYRHAQRTDVNELRSRVTVAAAVVDAAFAGDRSTLDAIAAAPAFVRTDRPAMGAYLRRFAAIRGQPFNGGLGWADARGRIVVSSRRRVGGLSTSVADRSYFGRVMRTGSSYVSGG